MTTPDVFRDAEYIADVSGILTGQDSGTISYRDDRMKKVQSAAKIAFIDRLLRDLDILIYCELSALYYLDCSIILFAIRTIVQLIFFTPKVPPFDPTRNQPYIGAIFASNIFCMVCHNFFSPPEADETTRGYLHGGLLIDFIGQKAPVSLVRLLSLDVLVILLNLIMLGLIVERVKVTETTATASTETSTPSQDHDSEERGVLRDNSGPAPIQPSGDGIELSELDSHGAHVQASPDEQLERTGLLTDSSEERQAKNNHAMDSFFSGQAVIMDLGFFDLIRDRWRYTPTTLPRRTFIPSQEAAAFLRQRFGLQVRPDGGVTRIES